MVSPKTKGRMIRKDISRSSRVAALSPKACALFCLILPHLDAHGKANGDPGYVKAEMVPLIPWMTIPAIKKSLIEIDMHTNVKWFRGKDATWYLHALKFDEHQELNPDRRGRDDLPNHPSFTKAEATPELLRSKSGVIPPEVEVERKEKEKEKEKENLKSKDEESGIGPRPLGRAGLADVKRPMSTAEIVKALQQCQGGEFDEAACRKKLQEGGTSAGEIESYLKLTPDELVIVAAGLEKTASRQEART